jgi:hypothetical protein
MQNLAQNVVNTVCPVCGMPVDETLPAVVALVTDDADGDHIHRIGACGVAHQMAIAQCPERFVAAALSNQLSSASYDDA